MFTLSLISFSTIFIGSCTCTSSSSFPFKEKNIKKQLKNLLFLSMASISNPPKPHFILFPLMAQGHLIPMVDIARILASQGVIITFVTTPQNAARFEQVLKRATDSGLHIQIIKLHFPFEEAGLPEGCENFDLLPSLSLAPNFVRATLLMRQAIEKLFEELSPRPSCLISDMAFPWTIEVSQRFQIPRLVFYSMSCFYLLSLRNLRKNKALLDSVASESEFFLIPNLPDQIEITKSQINYVPNVLFSKGRNEMVKADLASYGVIVNTFEELEPEYVKEYKRVSGLDRVWCIGPVSLCNKDTLDLSQRGNKASIDGFECLKWLDRQQPCSVIYVALGSFCNVILAQLVELGLALEESSKPFIWVIRQGKVLQELEKWISEYGFEEKTKGRGLVIHGWAPQVLILSHPAVGGFITHCGWNSTTEAISAGVPLITWPLFGDQFFNEKLIVQVLKIGIRVGVEKCVMWGDEEKVGVLVKKEEIRDAIYSLMNGEERDEIKERARELSERTKRAVETGGSSHLNMKLLIADIVNQGASYPPDF